MKASPERRALFGLALQLGRTVAELEATLSAQEFVQWLAWFEIREQKAKPEDAAMQQWFQIEGQ